jgi:hypothetical protein
MRVILNPRAACSGFQSKIKIALRKAKARTIEVSEHALKKAFASIADSDARAGFSHCGYAVY